MVNKIKIAVVDDHHLFRQGLVSLLKDEKELSVIIEASNGEELMELIGKDTPDVVLLDIEMPIMNGIETTVLLKKKYPEVKIIILTMHDEEGMIVKMIEKGAHGFLLKGTDIEKLAEAIHSVIETGYYFNDNISQALLEDLVNDNRIELGFDTVALNKLEREVIKLVCKELTNKEIGEQLDLSVRTVDRHKSAIFKKIGARNTAGMVLYAVKHKLHKN